MDLCSMCCMNLVGGPKRHEGPRFGHMLIMIITPRALVQSILWRCHPLDDTVRLCNACGACSRWYAHKPASPA